MTELATIVSRDKTYSYNVNISFRQEEQNTVKIADKVLANFSQLRAVLDTFHGLQVLDLTQVQTIHPGVMKALLAWNAENSTVKIQISTILRPRKKVIPYKPPYFK